MTRTEWTAGLRGAARRWRIRRALIAATVLTSMAIWVAPATAVGASCAIAVYVPGTGNVLDAAGAPATYLVYATVNATGTPIAEFTVDQVHNQGGWVNASTFRLAGDQLAVRLATRGIDWGPGRAGAHLGVSALRARC